MLMLHLKAGIARTFVYQLADHGADEGGAMGLLDADGGEKPAWRQLSALMRELDDPSPTGGKGAPPLDVALDGELGNLEAMLFAKTDGTYRLVLWLETPSFDPVAARVLDVASQQPQAWSWGDTAFMIGIENLTVDHTASPGTSGVGFHNAYNCWISNIKSLNGKRNHVWLNQAARIEVRDSYFYGTQTATSMSYGVESFTSSDDVVANNVFQHVTSPIMLGHYFPGAQLESQQVPVPA
jgi:hypothetical protein